ncbi:hypothetical protein ABZT51_03850 [Streptomyces sp. NPDC005373]|uniref:hypothetical protein n=1 Tax=unclassified Streptomyces TaxID=2593676 RepID=UPI0033AEC448
MAALSPRLRKRLDAAVEKLAARPVTSDGGICRIAVDDETFVELHAPGGTVTAEGAIRCGCLLAPACVHRAAAATSHRSRTTPSRRPPPTRPISRPRRPRTRWTPPHPPPSRPKPAPLRRPPPRPKPPPPKPCGRPISSHL